MQPPNIINDFFNNKNGAIVCVSGSLTLFKSIKYALGGHATAADESIIHHENIETAAKHLATMHSESRPFILVVERLIQRNKTTDFIVRIRNLYPETCLLLVGSDITQELTAYFYELGVSAILLKPTSAHELSIKIEECLDKSKEFHLSVYVRSLIAAAEQEQALDAIDAFIQHNPKSALAYCLKGDVLLTNGNIDEAEKAYHTAKRLSLYYIEPLKRMAALKKHIDDRKALDLLQTADQINPFNPDRKLELAEIYLRKGDEELAKNMLETGYKQASKEYSFFLSDYAERAAELASSAPDIAEPFLERIVNTKKHFTSHDLHIFNKLGMIHRNNRRWQKALEVYKKALEISPNDPALYYNMALAYQDGNKRSEVRRSLAKALSINEDFYKNNEGVSYNIGSLFLKYGDMREAKLYFEHVIEINPNNNKAQEKLKQCIADSV